MANGPKLDLSAVLSNDERAVIETHPHEARLYAGSAVNSVLSIVCFLVGLNIYRLVRSWVSDVPHLPQVPAWLVEAYEYFFGSMPWWAIGLMANVFVIGAFFMAAFRDTRMEYFATNKRIIWWNKHAGKVEDSIPLTSVKMVRLRQGKRAMHRRYGDIVFSSVKKSEYPYTWLRITEPASVLRRLQQMTPEPDPGYARKHHVIGWTLALIGFALMFLAVVILYLNRVWLENEPMVIACVLMLAGLPFVGLGWNHVMK